MNDTLINDFIETWGAMGSFWGINNSVARVHGLLVITDRPWCIDEIVDRLQLSKSNVSTSLKELRGWNVIRKVIKPGDRREFYVCEPNAWEMLFKIMRYRKQREFDPILESVSRTCELAEEDPDGIDLSRLQQMKEMLNTLNRAATVALSSESQVRALLSLFAKG